jgi:hypothetical protein
MRAGVALGDEEFAVAKNEAGADVDGGVRVEGRGESRDFGRTSPLSLLPSHLFHLPTLL